MSPLKNVDRRWIWIGLGISMMVLRIILSYFPHLIETFYSRGLFQIYRYISDYTISLSPVPLLYVFLLLFAGWGIFNYLKRKHKQRTYKSKILSFFFSLSAFTGGLIFFFILLWGFNYVRIPLEKQLNILPDPLANNELKAEFERASSMLFEIYSRYELEKNTKDYELVNLENEMRIEVVKTLQRFGYPTPGRVRARLIKPKGLLLRISTAGVYLPWVGECHIDAGLHPIQIPNVMAHELAHGYGITDEGACNFIALQTCLNADNLFYQYSGSLSYWKTVASNYRQNFPGEYNQFKTKMPQGILEDIRAINENLDKYPDIFPDGRDFFYNNYLKSQGISEGLQNYSRVILLEVAYKKAQEKNYK